MPARIVALFASIAVASLALSARADQPRDWMLEGVKAGNQLVVDYFGTGGQLAFDHRENIYGSTNDWSTRVSSMITYPLAQLQVAASLRLVFLEFGAAGGYRSVWRNLSFEPGDDGEYCKGCDQKSRRHRDPILGKGPDTDRYGFAEFTVRLFAPFNEYIVLTSSLTARYEDSRLRTYDWFFCNVHDGGLITNWETLAFIKHRDWGGIGPYFQLMSLPRAGKHDTEFAAGFNAVTRLGLLERNDLLFLTFLMRPGDNQYGQHSYYLPIRALIIYRAVFSL